MKYLLGFLLTGALVAQQPAFEVASIRAAAPIQSQISSGKMHVGMTVDAARVDIGFMSLADLLPLAFQVKPYQISGPSWMSTERFDIVATLPEGATKEQVPQMLQALLADRFKLTVHRENKERAVYALLPGKGGPKMKEAAPEEEKPAVDAPKGDLAIGDVKRQFRVEGKGAVVTGGPMGTTRLSMTPGPTGAMHIEFGKMAMGPLADMLSRMVDRPVVDMTELKGNYQVALDVAMQDVMGMARAFGGGAFPGAGGASDPSRPADAASDPSGGSIFQSVQQLGLKLEPRKAPVEIVVVDRLEKAPTDN